MQTKPLKTFPTKVKAKILAPAHFPLEKLDCGTYPATYLDLKVSAIILDTINYQVLISEYPYVLPFYDVMELENGKVALIVPRITGNLETHPLVTKRQAIAAVAGICKAFAYLLAQGVSAVQDIESKDIVMTDGVAINPFHLPEADSANKTIKLTNLIYILLEIFYKNPSVRPQESAEKDSYDEAIKSTLFLLNSREQFAQVDEAITHLLQIAKNFDTIGEAFSIRRMTTYTPEQQSIIEQVNRMSKLQNAFDNSLYDFFKKQYDFRCFCSGAFGYSTEEKERSIKAKELKQTSSSEVRIDKLKENLSNIKKNRLSQIHEKYLIKFPESQQRQGDVIQTNGEYFGTPVTLLELTINLAEPRSARIFETIQSAPRHPNLGKFYGYIQGRNSRFTFILHRDSKGSLFETIHRAGDNFPWYLRLRLFNDLISLVHFTHSMDSYFIKITTNLIALNDSYHPFLSLMHFISPKSDTTANIYTSSTKNNGTLSMAHKVPELFLVNYRRDKIKDHRKANTYHLATLFWSLWQRADILYTHKLTDITIRNHCKPYEATDIVLKLIEAGLGPRFFDLTKIRTAIRNLESFPNTWGKLLKEIPQLDNFFRAYLERMNEGHLAPSLIKPVGKYTVSLLSELKNSDLKYARSGVIYFSPSHCYFRVDGKLHKWMLPKTLGITAENLTRKLKDCSFMSQLQWTIPPLQALLNLEKIGDRLLLDEVKNMSLPKDKQSLLSMIDDYEKHWLTRSRKDMKNKNPQYEGDLTAPLTDLNLPEDYAEELELCVKNRISRIEVAELQEKILKGAYPKFKAKEIYQMIRGGLDLNLVLSESFKQIRDAIPVLAENGIIPPDWNGLITKLPRLENLSQMFLIWEFLEIMPPEYADFWQSLEYWKNLNKLPLTWTELQDTFALVESFLKANIKPIGWEEFYKALSRYQHSVPIEFSVMQAQLYKLRLKYELTDTDLFKTKIPVEFFEHPSLLLKKILDDLEKVNSNMPSSQWVKEFSHAPLLSQILNIWEILDILPPAWQSLHSVFQAMKNSEIQCDDLSSLKKILSDSTLLAPTDNLLPLEWQGKEIDQLNAAKNFSPFKVQLQANKIPLVIPAVFANSSSESTPESEIAEPESVYSPEFH